MFAAVHWVHSLREFRRSTKPRRFGGFEVALLVYNGLSHHESTPRSHWKYCRSRTLSGTPARHRLHGRRGVHLFHHGLSDEAPLGPLRAAADLLPALHLLVAVFAADHCLAGKLEH